eukprot:6827576-Prymnesium_polylepis.1
MGGCGCGRGVVWCGVAWVWVWVWCGRGCGCGRGVAWCGVGVGVGVVWSWLWLWCGVAWCGVVVCGVVVCGVVVCGVVWGSQVVVGACARVRVCGGGTHGPRATSSAWTAASSDAPYVPPTYRTADLPCDARWRTK